jgi:ArsR family transcriptional regulator, arsenate/arsenite/antimonite-responsive transcriptional repressor
MNILLYTECFKALSDKTRLRIFYLLSFLNKELAVCEIMDSINESLYNVSRHLKILKYAGLIKENKQSRWVLYSLNLENEKQLPDMVKLVRSLDKSLFADDIKRAIERLNLRKHGKIVCCTNKRARNL